MNDQKKRITLNRDPSVANYVITMSSIITDAINQKEIVVEGNKLMIKKRDATERHEFNENYKELMDKIIFDFFPDTSIQYLHLTEAESELFKKCSHAAYYFAKENDKDTSSLKESFIKVHEKYFKR